MATLKELRTGRYTLQAYIEDDVLLEIDTEIYAELGMFSNVGIVYTLNGEPFFEPHPDVLYYFEEDPTDYRVISFTEIDGDI